MSRLFEPVKKDMIFITENGAYVNCRGYTMLDQTLEWKDVRDWVQLLLIPESPQHAHRIHACRRSGLHIRPRISYLSGNPEAFEGA